MNNYRPGLKQMEKHLSKAKIRRVEMFELKNIIVKMKSLLDGFNSLQLLQRRMKRS